MSRWNEEITLIKTEGEYQDEEGTWHEGERRERVTFCSPQIIGTMTMAQLRSSEVRITNGKAVPEVGLRKMAMVLVRNLEYEDEPLVIYRGQEMQVISAAESGENVKLLLGRKLGNG